MSRVRVAIEVSDVDKAVAFYAKALGAEPVDAGDRFAEFVLDDPALHLLITTGDHPGSVRNVGIEVTTATELDTVSRRLRSGRIAFDGGEEATCCDDYLTDLWVTDPDGAGWEFTMPVGDGVDAAACRSSCCTGVAATPA